MQDNNKKYQGNPLGLSPDLLGMLEALGRAFVGLQKGKRKNKVVDIEYEVVEPKQLTENISRDEKA